MNIDKSLDYQVWDDVEPLTFTVKGTTDAPYSVATALRRAPTWKELSASNGAYTAQDVVWLVPAALLSLAPNANDQPPPTHAKPGDKVTDSDGTIFTVLQADPIATRSVWRLITRDLVLAYNLRDSIDIQRPAVTYDTAGGAVRAWPDGNVNSITAGGTTVYAGLAAKVQKLTDELVTMLGVSGFSGDFAVIIGQDIVLESEDRVKWVKDGMTYYLDIVGQHNPQRIDELPVLDCKIRP